MITIIPCQQRYPDYCYGVDHFYFGATWQTKTRRMLRIWNNMINIYAIYKVIYFICIVIKIYLHTVKYQTILYII